MNLYGDMARGLKIWVEKHPEEEEGMRQKITALEILDGMDRDTQLLMFDTGAFNDICRGYLLMALRNTDVPQETINDVMGELGYLFDSLTAGQAENYYKNH